MHAIYRPMALISPSFGRLHLGKSVWDSLGTTLLKPVLPVQKFP